MIMQREALRTAQPAAVEAEARDVEVASDPDRLRPGTREACRGVDTLLLVECPRLPQLGLAGSADSVVALLGEVLSFDADVAPQLVQQHMHDLPPSDGLRSPERLADVRPL